MSTADIANTLLSLQPATLQEMLEHVGILISCKAQHVMGKTEMIKMFEDSIIEIGIEYLLAKCNNEVINKMAIKLGVPSRKGIVERIRWLGIPSFLQLVDDPLGMFESPNRYSAVAEISEEIIYCGIREIISRLFSTHILFKVCLEYRLINFDSKPQEKEYLVQRLLCKLDA